MNKDESEPESDFERAGQQSSSPVLLEFWCFIKHNKKWWMIPILVALLALGVLAALGSTGAAPFIYTLF